MRVKIFHSHENIFSEALMFGMMEQIDARWVVTQMEVGNYVKVWDREDSSRDTHMTMLNLLYRLSQNIEDDWNPENPCRSTSIGDVIQIDDDLYVVASRGFTKISD